MYKLQHTCEPHIYTHTGWRHKKNKFYCWKQGRMNYLTLCEFWHAALHIKRSDIRSDVSWRIPVVFHISSNIFGMEVIAMVASCPPAQFNILLANCTDLLAEWLCTQRHWLIICQALWGMRPTCQQRAHCFSDQRWRLESEADPATLQAKWGSKGRGEGQKEAKESGWYSWVSLRKAMAECCVSQPSEAFETSRQGDSSIIMFCQR